jgi:hypothetical protein
MQHAEGIAALLVSVKSSADVFSGDDVCSFLIDECLALLRANYSLDAESKPPANGETSFPAIIRLLLYVRAELIDELGDTRCADLMQACIDHLLRAHLHYQGRPNDPTINAPS